MTDPAIHSPIGLDNKRAVGIAKFFETHVCNSICEELGLTKQKWMVHLSSQCVFYCTIEKYNSYATNRQNILLNLSTSPWLTKPRKAKHKTKHLQNGRLSLHLRGYFRLQLCFILQAVQLAQKIVELILKSLKHECTPGTKVPNSTPRSIQGCNVAVQCIARCSSGGRRRGKAGWSGGRRQTKPRPRSSDSNLRRRRATDK